MVKTSPPLLIHDKLISVLGQFNIFLVSPCTPLDNSSKIPENQTYVTNTKLSSIKFENKDIINIIRSLSVGKAHVHDNISIKMLNIYDSTIVEPLQSCSRTV